MTSTSPTLTAMRAAVVREPSDDTVRLAYADALDEFGGKHKVAHAKMIRLMIRWERDFSLSCNKSGRFALRLPRSESYDAQWLIKHLRRNYTSLCQFRLPRVVTHYRHYILSGRQPVTEPVEWNSNGIMSELSFGCDFPADHTVGYHLRFCSYHFRRGFVSHVRCHWPHWSEFGSLITANEPIESVHLTTWPPLNIDGLLPRDSVIAIHTQRFRALYPTVSTWTFPQ